MTRVPLVCAYAHCYTISRKVLANSAMKRMEIILRGSSICSINRGNSNARVLVSYTRIRLVRTFSLRCLPFFFYTMSPIFFLQAHKQFRYAARFIFTLTATEQLQTKAMSATYPHLATFAPYG